MQPLVDPMTAAALTGAVLQMTLLLVGVWVVRTARMERAQLEVRLWHQRQMERRRAGERRLYEEPTSIRSSCGDDSSLYLD